MFSRKAAGTVALGLALALTGGAGAQAFTESHYFEGTRMRVAWDHSFRVTADGKDDVYGLKVWVKDRTHKLTNIYECFSDAPDEETCAFYSIASKADRSTGDGTRWKRTKRGWVGTLEVGVYGDGGVDQEYCEALSQSPGWLTYNLVMQADNDGDLKVVSLGVPIKCRLNAGVAA